MTRARHSEPEGPGKERTALVALFLLAGALLAPPAWAAASTAPVSVNLLFSVNDSEGHAVPDAMIVVNYQTDGNRSELDGVRQGFTDVSGTMRTRIFFASNITPPQYLYASAYTPFWSSDRVTLRIPETGARGAEANFTLPLALDTYRLNVEKDGLPFPGANVRLFEPMFASKRTDQDGVAQFRLPRGGRVHGDVEYAGFAQEFEFRTPDQGPGALGTPDQTNPDIGTNRSTGTDTSAQPVNASGPQASNQTENPPQVFNQTIRIPFENPVFSVANDSRIFSVQMFDSARNLLTIKPFNVSAPGVEDTYFSDSNGIIYLRDVPYDSLNLTWFINNITYNATIDTRNPPARIDTPVLLTIQPPDIASLGDDCYRIRINITDPRPDAIEQVVAKAKDSQDQLPFIMESSQISADVLNFQRILCVVEDTQFYITAANQYEETSMQIQLLKNNKRPDATPSVAFVVDRVPPVERKSIENKLNTEYAVILGELLAILLVIYIILRFKNVVAYYLQIVVRTAYFFLHNARARRKKGDGPTEPKPPGAAS